MRQRPMTRLEILAMMHRNIEDRRANFQPYPHQKDILGGRIPWWNLPVHFPRPSGRR